MTFTDDLIENIERIGRGNYSTGGDITEHESYDSSKQLGPENDFSRDFHAGTDTVPTGDGSTTKALIKHQNMATLGSKDNPATVLPQAATGITTAQYLVTATPIQIVGGKPARRGVRFVNFDTTNTLYIGANTAVTVYTGYPVPPGATVEFPVSCSMWAVSGIANGVAVGVIEFLGE